ncbi:MAG: cobalamin-binding protein [Thermoplasmata archaeon]|nr:cobalamin-binding protein [Thermoplasmata archaeon]
MRVRTPDSHLSSGEIDARVRSVRGEGESLYLLDLEVLQTLSPDVILTQDLCRVCSVTDEEVRVACRQVGIDPAIVSLTPSSLDGVWEGIQRVGDAIGAGAEATKLVRELRRRSSPGESRDAKRPTTAVLEWLDPPIIAGLWTPEMIRAAGGEPWEATGGMPGRRTEWSAVARAELDLLVLSPCSFPVERTRAESEAEPTRSALDRIAPSLGVWIADEAYFSRPGPRLIDGVELLRGLLAGQEPPGKLPCERYLGTRLGAAR